MDSGIGTVCDRVYKGQAWQNIWDRNSEQWTRLSFTKYLTVARHPFYKIVHEN